jgi:alpha-amylase
MVGFRAATMDAWHVTDWWDDTGNRIAFGRGSAGFVVINADGSPLSRTFQTSLPAGSYCDIISGDFNPGGGGTCTGTAVTVDASGQVTLTIPAMSAAAIHIGAKLGGP